jgi:hypothetical protein
MRMFPRRASPSENIQSWNRHEANEAAPKATILVNFSCFIIHDAVMWPVSEEQTRAVQTWGDVLPIFIFAGRPRKSTDENSWLAITTLVCMVCSSLVVFARTWQGLFQSAANGRCPKLCRARKGQEKVASRTAKAKRTCTTCAGTQTLAIHTLFALLRVQETLHDKALPDPCFGMVWPCHVQEGMMMWSIKDASCIFA